VYKLDSFVGFIGDEQLHAQECYAVFKAALALSKGRLVLFVPKKKEKSCTCLFPRKKKKTAALAHVVQQCHNWLGHGSHTKIGLHNTRVVCRR
jgi:hypothetical protein